jgi:hypothetical protein
MNKKEDRVFNVLKELDMGFIPHEFTFNLEPKCQIDWTKLKYNDWADIDYWLAKMPDGLLEQFPSLIDWAIESNIENTKKTPLTELEERKSDFSRELEERMSKCNLVSSSEDDQ